MLASAGFDDAIILWDVQTGERIGPAFRVHQRAINAVAFGRDETEDILLSGSDDSTVILWDLSTRQPLSQLVKEAQPFTNIGKVVTSNEMRAAAEGQQITLLNNAQKSKTLSGHTGAVNTLNFSPQSVDGRRLLVSASDDQTVILWDVTTVADADVFLKLEGFNNPVTSAYFSADGKLLLFTESGGQITQWIIDPAEWVRLACETIKPSLTISEQEYQKTCGGNP